MPEYEPSPVSKLCTFDTSVVTAEVILTTSGTV